MDRKEWLELVEEHENEIIEALEEAFAKSCRAPLGLVRVVVLDVDGHVSIREHIGGNTTDGDVWHGTAIEIARAESFAPTDGDEFDGFPATDAYLSDEEKAAFISWAKVEGYKRLTPRELEEWNPDLHESWLREYIDEYISAYSSDWAWERLERAKSELRQLAAEESETRA